MPVSQISTTITQCTTVHLKSPPNHHFVRKIQHFYVEDKNKNTARNSPKHAISGENFKLLRALSRLGGDIPSHAPLLPLPALPNRRGPRSGGSTTNRLNKEKALGLQNLTAKFQRTRDENPENGIQGLYTEIKKILAPIFANKLTYLLTYLYLLSNIIVKLYYNCLCETHVFVSPGSKFVSCQYSQWQAYLMNCLALRNSQ